jgi:hypothetical protein
MTKVERGKQSFIVSSLRMMRGKFLVKTNENKIKRRLYKITQRIETESLFLIVE